jgi:hypothetical protein
MAVWGLNPAPPIGKWVEDLTGQLCSPQEGQYTRVSVRGVGRVFEIRHGGTGDKLQSRITWKPSMAVVAE